MAEWNRVKKTVRYMNLKSNYHAEPPIKKGMVCIYCKLKK